MSKRRAKPPETPARPPEHLALQVDRIGVVGVTEEGEHFGMELQFISGERATVLFPMALFQRLTAAMMAAGAAAYSQQLARLGSEENVLMHLGCEPFAPTGYDLGRGRTLEGADAILVRLKKERLPVVDFTLSFGAAEHFARELLGEVGKGSATRKVVQ